MRVVIPFDANAPKSRLSTLLEPEERREFAVAMLRDVVSAVEATGRTPTVLSTEPVDVAVPVEIDDRPLTPLVNAAIDASTPVAIVMADLALVTPEALERLFGADGDIVIAPGQEAGTNAIVVREPAFRVDYHGASFADHLEAARAIGASVREIDSFRLSADVDEPDDLLDVLVHGAGAAARWLRTAGFRVEIEDEEPRVTR